MAHTIRRAALAAGACVLLAAAGCSRPPARAARAPHVAPALTFTIRMVATPSDGRASRTESIPAQFRDGVLRVDVPGAPDTGGRHRGVPGSYVLVNFAAKTTTIVMPTWRQYWETRFDSASGRRTRSKTVITDIDVSGSALGSGGTVNGFATTRYRITTRYTASPSNTRKEERSKQVHLVEDIWVPDALKDLPDPMQAYLRVFGAGVVGELSERQAEARRKLFTGLPVRATWQLTETFPGGNKSSRTVTADLLDVKRADLDPAAFRAPAGYNRLDIAAVMNAFGRLLNGAGDATNESARGRKTP